MPKRLCCCGQRPISFCSLAVWTVAFSRPAFGCCSSLSQTNMTANVSGSGPFKQPFNKTSSAVRHTGSLVLGSPAENTLPPVSKPSAFGSPRRALSCGVYLNLLRRSRLFSYARAMWHLGEIQHVWSRFYSHYRSRPISCGRGNGGRFLMWCRLGRAHPAVTRARDDGCSDAREACCVCQTFSGWQKPERWEEEQVKEGRWNTNEERWQRHPLQGDIRVSGMFLLTFLFSIS